MFGSVPDYPWGCSPGARNPRGHQTAGKSKYYHQEKELSGAQRSSNVTTLSYCCVVLNYEPEGTQPGIRGQNSMDFILFPCTLNVQFHMVFTLFGCVFVKNQPKKSRLDVYKFFISFVIVLASEAARVPPCTFTQWLVPSYYPLCSGASFLPYYFTAHFNL